MIHSLYILVSISKTSFSKLPIHQQHLRQLSPRRDEVGMNHPVLQRVASFMSLEDWKQSLHSCLSLPTGEEVHLAMKLKAHSQGSRMWLPGKGVCVKSFQSCLTLCDLVDCRPPGPSVRGISQARTLESVAMPFSRD